MKRQLEGHHYLDILDVIAIGMIAASYVKNSIFLHKQSNKELFIFLLLLAVSTSFRSKNILRIKHLNLEQKNFIQQTTEVKKLLEQGNKIEFNFSGKKDNLQCYILNYNLVPYLGKKSLQECIKASKEAIIETKEEAVYAPFK